jgi:hypothetical protein
MRFQVFIAVKVKVRAFWYIIHCTISWAVTNISEKPVNVTYTYPERWRQQVLPKRWQLFTKLDCVMTQNTITLFPLICLTFKESHVILTSLMVWRAELFICEAERISKINLKVVVLYMCGSGTEMRQ